jgi:hypothetical protein
MVMNMKVLIPSGVRYDQMFGNPIYGTAKSQLWNPGKAKHTGQGIDATGIKALGAHTPIDFLAWLLKKIFNGNTPTPEVPPVPVVPEPVVVGAVTISDINNLHSPWPQYTTTNSITGKLNSWNAEPGAYNIGDTTMLALEINSPNKERPDTTWTTPTSYEKNYK